MLSDNQTMESTSGDFENLCSTYYVVVKILPGHLKIAPNHFSRIPYIAPWRTYLYPRPTVGIHISYEITITKPLTGARRFSCSPKLT
jgi:hypothetical protein